MPPPLWKDRARKITAAQRAAAQRLHTGRTGTLPCQSDAFRVAAKAGNIAAHPLEGKDLVQQAVVARNAVFTFGAELLIHHPAKHIQPVVDGDQDHALAGKMFSVKMRRMAVARHKRAAVYPKDHRQLFLGRLGGSPHIQIQAVLAHGLCHRVKLPLIKAAGLHP